MKRRESILPAPFSSLKPQAYPDPGGRFQGGLHFYFFPVERLPFSFQVLFLNPTSKYRLFFNPDMAIYNFMKSEV
jgi:hypothetical protein